MADTQTPPTSGFQHHRAVVIHMARHYLTYHLPVGDPVNAVNVPGEDPSEQVSEDSADSN